MCFKWPNTVERWSQGLCHHYLGLKTQLKKIANELVHWWYFMLAACTVTKSVWGTDPTWRLLMGSGVSRDVNANTLYRKITFSPQSINIVNMIIILSLRGGVGEGKGRFLMARFPRYNTVDGCTGLSWMSVTMNGYAVCSTTYQDNYEGEQNMATCGRIIKMAVASMLGPRGSSRYKVS